VEDEEVWKWENRTSPPFLLLLLGPSKEATVTSGHIQRREGTLTTHNCFPAAKQELRELEASILESAIVAISIGFADHRHPVRLTGIARDVFGKASTGEPLYDFLVTASAELSVSSPIDSAALLATAKYASEIHRRLDMSVGRYYYMGLSEGDPAKAFLYHFFFLERFVHLTFLSSNLGSSPISLAQPPPRIAAAVTALGRDTLTAGKTLLARFVLCAWHLWQDINDDNVTTFKQLKKERDRFSHGKVPLISASLARRTQEFASLVVRAAIPHPST
jgi:hypothetical protein